MQPRPATLENLLELFAEITQAGEWKLEIERPFLIRLRNEITGNLFCPLRVVYMRLTAGRDCGGSFLMPEMQTEFGFPETLMVDCAHAIDACDTGRNHSPALREKILRALGASDELIEKNVRRFPKSF